MPAPACLVAVQATDFTDLANQAGAGISDLANQAGAGISDLASQAGAGIEGAAKTVSDFAVGQYNNVKECMDAAGDDHAKKALCTTEAFKPNTAPKVLSGGISMMAFTVLLAFFFQ